MSQPARINGEVVYREGDGAPIPIRKGQCEVEVTALDATISWVDGDTHGSAAMPLSDFKRFLASKAIVLAEPAPASAPASA